MKVTKHDNKVLSEEDRQILDNLEKPDPIHPQIHSQKYPQITDYSFDSLRYILKQNKSPINYDTDFNFEQYGSSLYLLALTHKKTNYEALFEQKEIEKLSFFFEGNRLGSFKDFLDEIENHVENIIFDDDYVDFEINIDYGFGCDEFTITLFNKNDKSEQDISVANLCSKYTIAKNEQFHQITLFDDDNLEEENTEPRCVIIPP